MICGIVAPSGRLSILMTVACLLLTRVRGVFGPARAAVLMAVTAASEQEYVDTTLELTGWNQPAQPL